MAVPDPPGRPPLPMDVDADSFGSSRLTSDFLASRMHLRCSDLRFSRLLGMRRPGLSVCAPRCAVLALCAEFAGQWHEAKDFVAIDAQLRPCPTVERHRDHA